MNRLGMANLLSAIWLESFSTLYPHVREPLAEGLVPGLVWVE